jgi:hypothetical protein
MTIMKRWKLRGAFFLELKKFVTKNVGYVLILVIMKKVENI